MKRHAFACAALLLGAALNASAAAPKKTLDLTNSDDQLRLQVKLACSLQDGKPALYWWSGRVYSRVQGEPDRHIFDVHGLNIRQCATKTDPVRGFGYKSVSREIMLYLDPATGQVLRKWRNPWTGKDVDVVHVANDPVNLGRWLWSRDEQGKPVDRSAGTVVKGDLVLEGGGAARLFYKNPLAGDYQDYVGGWYHAMEFGSQSASAKEALDANDTELENAVITWGRISKWLPWMEMGDREGVVIFHTAGMRLDDYNLLPEVVRKELDANYPQYREPPPIDDARPNETSWTVFKRFIDAKRAAAPKQ